LFVNIEKLISPSYRGGDGDTYILLHNLMGCSMMQVNY